MQEFGNWFLFLFCYRRSRINVVALISSTLWRWIIRELCLARMFKYRVRRPEHDFTWFINWLLYPRGCAVVIISQEENGSSQFSFLANVLIVSRECQWSITSPTSPDWRYAPKSDWQVSCTQISMYTNVLVNLNKELRVFLSISGLDGSWMQMPLIWLKCQYWSASHHLIPNATWRCGLTSIAAVIGFPPWAWPSCPLQRSPVSGPSTWTIIDVDSRAAIFAKNVAVCL